MGIVGICVDHGAGSGRRLSKPQSQIASMQVCIHLTINFHVLRGLVAESRDKFFIMALKPLFYGGRGIFSGVRHRVARA
jgi:hypothetical protein